MASPAADIADHARFFDHLVELVPARYYYDDEFARVNPRYLAKAARDALRADAKSKAKVAKRDKLDPTKAATTLELQRRKLQAAHQAGPASKARAGGGADAGADAGAPSTSGRAPAAGAAAGQAPAGPQLQLQLSGTPLSRQELLDRLHKKVEESRQRRKAAADVAVAAKEWRQNALRDNVKAKAKQHERGGKEQRQAGNKRKAAAGAEEDGAGPAAQQQQRKQQQQQPHKSQQQAKKQRRDEDGGGSGHEENADFKFARIELDDGRDKHGKHGKKPPKAVLLKQAEAQKAELAALAGSQEGQAKAQQVAWKAALARAGGEKVLDDPKLLRRSLKRESKRREKHGKAWQARIATQQETQAARQTKRNENLAVRRQTKVDNKKAKREKKLLRPGFEGRREGFIGGDGGKAAAGAK